MNSGDIAGALREYPEGCSLAVRVQPGAKQSAIAGIYGEGAESRLKIALKAPAIEGRANEALIAFLAERLELPRLSVSIAHGQSSRSKLVILRGMNAAQARTSLGRLLSAQ